MGKIAKPQRSKKHKKIKAVDPFYHGSRKDAREEGWNQKPKDYHQEIPRKLRKLGLTRDGIRCGNVGKKSKNKFHKHPDAPKKYSKQFPSPLGANSDSKQNQPKSADLGKRAVESDTQSGMSSESHHKKFKSGFSPKPSKSTVNDYVDSLKPIRSFVTPFEFKKKHNETDMSFMRRVNYETNKVLTKSQIADQFEISDEKKMLMKVKTSKGRSEKKKQRLKEKKQRKLDVLKERKREKLLDFDALEDKVVFGDIVHAPPVLAVRPKKAVVEAEDRPGLRMLELKAVISNMRESVNNSWSGNDVTKGHKTRQLGKSVKRKDLPLKQQCIADLQRENFIDAYRQMKKGRHRHS